MLTKEESRVFLENTLNEKTQSPSSLESGKAFVITKKIMKNRSYLAHLALLVSAVLTIWLLGLTIIREHQIRELSREVESLKADSNNIRSRVMEKLEFLDELKESNLIKEIRELSNFEHKEGVADLDQMFIPDDGDGDDYDDGEENDDDEESTTETNSEEYDDFADVDELGLVMEGKLVLKSGDDVLPLIKKVMRILPEDMENDTELYNRSKRGVIEETPDGVPILEEPYRVARAKILNQLSNIAPENLKAMPEHNMTVPRMHFRWNNTSEHPKRKHHKKYDYSTTESSLPTRSSRVKTDAENMRLMENPRVHRIRRVMMKSGPTSSDQSADYPNQQPDSSETLPMKPTRAGAKRNQGKNMLVAHFNGDTSSYRVGYTDHYDGNGRLRHPHDVPYTAWSPAPWLAPLGLDKQFQLQDGSVSVPESGIYFIYVQIYYHDEHDTNGYRVYRNNGIKDETLLQCTTMTHSTMRVEKSNTCYTAGAFHLSAGDNISVMNIGSMRYSIMEAGKSFFGFVMLSSTKLK